MTRGSRSVRHTVVPVVGLLILGFVMWSANVAAQVTGLTWLALGIVLAGVLTLTGRTPALTVSDEHADSGDEQTRSTP